MTGPCVVGHDSKKLYGARSFPETRAGRFGIGLVSMASPDGRKFTSREYAIQAVTELDADERGNSKR
jgi:hypothetical protein